MLLDDATIDDKVSVNTSGIRTVTTALEYLTSLCQEGKTHEAKILFEPTLARFQAVRHEYYAIAQEVDVGVYVSVLTAFIVKLRRHTTLPLCARIVDYQHLISFLDGIHTGKDGLEAALKVLIVAKHGEATQGRVEPWAGKEAFEEAKKTYPQLLDAAMEKLMETAKINLADGKPLIAEADAAFVQAMASKDAKQQHDLVVKWKEAVARLAKEANLPVHSKLPDWFITEGRVTYEPTAFKTGGFGSVHVGKWGSGTQVVIKQLLVKLGETATLTNEHFNLKQQEEFMGEVERWHKLKHPYVSQLWGACHVSKPPFMVCESAVKNGNLSEYIVLPIGQKRFWRLLYHMSLGVEYLHDKNLIHGDLKLNNVLVGDDGYSRVTDFGLSRFKRSADSYSTVQQSHVQSAGALRWRAPECVGPNAAKPQRPSDIYSLGMCLYEAFAREAPYGTLDNLSVEELIREGKLPERPKDVPDEAWKLITDMTHKDPARRPDIDTVARELYKFVAEEEKKEYEGIFVCVICGTEVPDHVGNKCRKCLKVVQTRQKDGTEPFTIKNKDDLPRVVEMLSSKSDAQRTSATSALKTYVFGDPVHQKEVSEARAMAVMAKIVRTEKEAVEVQRECQVTLGCVAVGNNVGQGDANYEDVIPRLVHVLNAGPERLKNKSAMVLGYLSYGNEKNQKEIVESENVLSNIEGMLNIGTEEERRAAKKALAILRSIQQPLSEEGPIAAAG